MKTKTIVAGMLILLGIFASCEKETIRVTGEVVRTEVNITGYSGLRVSNAFNVNVVFSDTEEKIVLEANVDIQDRIQIRKDGDNLIIKLKNFTNIRGNVTLNVFITTRYIDNFDISGASNLTLDNPLFTRQNISVELSGASNFTGEIVADELRLDASGASNTDIFGEVGVLNARLSGASTLKEYDLIVDTLNIQLSGASNAFLTVMKRIDIKASGASTLNYQGDAMIDTQNLSGASEINKTD